MKDLFQDWLKEKIAILSVFALGFLLWSAFQYNWVLYRNYSVLQLNYWDTLTFRIIFLGPVVAAIYLIATFMVSFFLRNRENQKLIRTIGWINLLLLPSVLIFVFDQFRFSILVFTLILFLIGYQIILFQFSKKIATTIFVLFLGILSVLFFMRKEYLLRKIHAHRILSKTQLVTLKNCMMERFGADNDGGYILCADLLDKSKASYSYSISGRDLWGCAVSKKLGIDVHQYDCFDLREPQCPNGKFIFHPECVGPNKERIDGREFDNIENQVEKNKNSGQRILFKMDIEGAEWNSFLAVPDHILKNIDQLVIEFHTDQNPLENNQSRSRDIELEVLEKLNQYFYAVNLHYNNYVCDDTMLPLPSGVYEILYVNKHIGIVDETSNKHLEPNPLDAPNNPDARDCQYLQNQIVY